MSKLNFTLEKELEIPAFSQENLLNLIRNNVGILTKDLDESSRITIQIKSNLDWDLSIDDTTSFRVPAYYLPIERSEIGFKYGEEARLIMQEALDIQKEASQDNPLHAHHYGHSVFRKLATAIVKLEKLRKIYPERSKIHPIENRDIFIATSFVDRLLEDGKKKLSEVKIQWEYKDWGNLGPDGDFKRFDSKKLSDLVGGTELFDQAIQDSLKFDVFEYINTYDKKNKGQTCSDKLTALQTELVKLTGNGALETIVNTQEIEQEAMPSPREQKPIVLSLSSRGNMGIQASDNMAYYFYNFDDEAFELVRVDNMQGFVWLMDEWREKDLLKSVSYIFINSAPPYFHGDSIEQFQLMMKYGIYNRGITGTVLDYDGGCVDDIKGIMRLIKGEYPELPHPIALCDGARVIDGYSKDDIVIPINDFNKSEVIEEVKKLVQIRN